MIQAAWPTIRAFAWVWAPLVLAFCLWLLTRHEEEPDRDITQTNAAQDEARDEMHEERQRQ